MIAFLTTGIFATAQLTHSTHSPLPGTLRIDNPHNLTTAELDIPVLKPGRPTWIVFYALPNGNSIEWTKGKLPRPGDDWHYDIQHIGAQTRFLRQVMDDVNLVVVYMSTYQKSWPAWKRQAAAGPAEIRRLVDSIADIFNNYDPHILLNSHSGGGSMVFGYIDAYDRIPDRVQRIAFIDSNYGFDDSLHTAKLSAWLSKPGHSLSVLAYNDSVVLFNGKPLVSPTGGTWYRSKLMQQRLGARFPMKETTDSLFINYENIGGSISFKLKTNAEGKIYHTEQVFRNGFIETVIGATPYQARAGYRYWGEPVYGKFID